MNADHFKGKWNQFKGELKKKWGAFTDDDLMKIEGDYDKFKGAVQSDTPTERTRSVDGQMSGTVLFKPRDPVGQPGRK